MTNGLVRHVDELGRISLPSELRRRLHIAEGTTLEVLVDRDMIVLRRWRETCVFCGRGADRQMGVACLCGPCLDKLKHDEARYLV